MEIQLNDYHKKVNAQKQWRPWLIGESIRFRWRSA